MVKIRDKKTGEILSRDSQGAAALTVNGGHPIIIGLDGKIYGVYAMEHGGVVYFEDESDIYELVIE